ncbi:MAG: YkgJ family cysteine cluster protein [Chthoniobacteraceae bacterium]
MGLCDNCGLCCNGVMFHTVQLQPADSAKELSALGLKLKRKKGRNFIQQPCPQYRASQCSIYALRPQRCRLFECRQLKALAAGEITEEMALEKIAEVQHLVAQVNEILDQAGTTDLKRPLSKRYEKIMAEPLDPTASEAAVALRHELNDAMRALETLLNEDFRIIRTGTPEGDEDSLASPAA